MTVFIVGLVVAFVLYFVATKAVHVFVSKFSTLAAVVIPAAYAYAALLALNPHDSFKLRLAFGLGLAGAGLLQNHFGKTLDKWDI